MFELQDITYRINNKKILDSINLKLSPNQITGIIGKTCSGKTSLLDVISQKNPQYSGNIFLEDSPINSLSKNYIKKTISSLGEIHSANSHLTVFDYILLSRIQHKKFMNPFSKEDMEIATEWMENFELQDLSNQKIVSLSYSISQRLKSAFSFASNNPIIVLDSPDSGMDIQSILLLQKAIFKYSIKKNSIIVVSSNNINFISMLCDRIIIMDKGKIAEDGNLDLINEDIIKKYFKTEILLSKNIYNGKPEIHIFPEN